MADLSVQAILSANTSGFQKGFQSAAGTARRFSQDMKHVQQSVNGIRFNNIDRGFGVFRQLQKQFDAGPAKQFFSSLDDFGDLFFFGGAITGAVAGVGSLVDLFIRGDKATFGFAGAINALRKSLGDVEPDLLKVGKVTQEFLDKFRKDQGKQGEQVFANVQDFNKEFLKPQDKRVEELLREGGEKILPAKLKAALDETRATLKESIKQAEKDVAGLSGVGGTLKRIELEIELAKAEPNLSFEERKARAAAAIQEAIAVGQRTIASRRGQLANINADAAFEVGRLSREEQRRIGARVEAQQALRGVAAHFGIVGQRFNVGLGAAGRAAGGIGQDFFNKGIEGLEKFQAAIDAAGEAAKVSARGPLGEYERTVSLLNDAFAQHKITKEQLGFGLLDAQGKLRNAINFDEIRDPKLLLKGTTAAFEEAERIRQADRNHDEVIEVAEQQLKELQDIGRIARANEGLVIQAAQF